MGAVVVLGGRSEIGLAVARRLVGDGARTVVLAARRADDLVHERQMLLGAGASTVECVEFDADAVDTHAALIEELDRVYGIDTVLVAFGVLGDQACAETDAAHALAVAHTDYVAQISVLTHLATVLRARGRGDIVVFSSVAGARVRRANYVYGSAKAGLDGFACGMADALHGTGVHLLLVRPGFVVGRMTTGMKPAPLSSTPDQVADAVVLGLRRRGAVVWVPQVLQPVFALLRLLPRAVWRRMPR
ncbi:MAG: SDR family NAD(P)-dependent oxidoreductase [Mycobacteriaceae bacterium]